MLVYKWIPKFHLVKIFPVLLRPTHLCCCLMVMLGNYADYIKIPFSMHCTQTVHFSNL